ncbi:hypothetical protein KOW79_011024 [Hemibagrus wyckioides]|uniref:Uncharacterized protein n=2 Tax=Hemibagrus wyckioides TaxID=337641 RepID=A0A9D3SMD6_9TELE|nr:hypothetical protein KOW79_011024 [Hemibagrus wyckioides]
MPRRKPPFDAQSEFLHADKQVELEEQHQMFLNEQYIIDALIRFILGSGGACAQETHQARGEHADSTHTVRGSETQTQDTGGVRQTTIIPVTQQNLFLIQHFCEWREDFLANLSPVRLINKHRPSTLIINHTAIEGCVDLHTKQIKELNISWRGGEQSTSININGDMTEIVQSFRFLCLHMLVEPSGTVIITALVNKAQLYFLRSFNTFCSIKSVRNQRLLGAQLPGRFVSEDYREPHTDELEALFWALTFSLKFKLDYPVRSHNDRFIIYDLQLKWEVKEYIWEKFELFSSEDDINNILENCYTLQCSEGILNVIIHYANVGEKDPKYIMINSWIYKVYPKKLYVFLVGKQLNGTENADKIESVIKSQKKKHSYTDIREGIRNCKEHHEDLYDLYSEYAQYTRETLQGVYTHGRLKPKREAWFTTYFLATVISESIRNYRSFITTLMALDLILRPNPERAEQEIILEKLPMARGGSWVNSDKRGFYGASTALNKKQKRKLEKLIREEEQICKKWLSLRNKSEIDREMLHRLLELVYGKHRLCEEPSLLQEFTVAYIHFKKKINSPISQELLRESFNWSFSLYT